MNKERGEQEPNIIEVLDNELKRGTSDPENAQTVLGIADKLGIDMFTLTHWLDTDKKFKEGLFAVKEAFDKDPWKDTPDDEVKLDAMTLSFGINFVLEETKKRYIV